MTRNVKVAVPDSVRAAAKATRATLAHKPGIAEVVSADDLADAAPFYFELRSAVAALKAARESAGLTLAEVAAKTGLALETLSRLETGAATNPTWQTLGRYAIAVGCRLTLGAVPTR
jgi:DNA-binding XRE family transcriptional regulator